jgi:hypothetical protein
MCSQEPLDGGAEFGANLLLHIPVGLGVAAHHPDQIVGDLLQGLVAEFEDGRAIGADRVVEGEFVVGEARTLTAPTFSFEGSGELHKFSDDLSGVAGVVQISQRRPREYFKGVAPGEDVAAEGPGDLTIEDALEHLDLTVLGL